MQIQEIPIQQVLVIRQEVMWPDKDLDFVKVPGDESAIHLGVFVEGEIKSVISLFKEQQSIQFRKFATLISEQGKGYGSILLKHVFEQFGQSDIEQIWCHARVPKAQFYEKFGMKKTGETFLKNGIEYVKMEKRIS
ncbi:GNAT family N-acetyltransferase [Aquirufa ecclesiirivi]|uniref:GNAT family N-acetyltransferase n=1 Tax=Aquirufa ecclesiirivi TaxID=2715124 RepID=A0ABT4JFH2_9BACT|nr:GNAT family N-acetyltransferase [Aquirufa ecclesiirivi]MCZ2475022.1 GNAT family N-acetyltransferase [Aquirufa ecclesiirivi]